jgi:hypothetical protein
MPDDYDRIRDDLLDFPPDEWEADEQEEWQRG